MPITTQIEIEEDKEKVRQWYCKGKGIPEVSKLSGYTSHVVRKFLMEEGVYRYAKRTGYVNKIKEPPNIAWSSNEFHYGKEGVNVKYSVQGLSYTERLLFNHRNHTELRKGIKKEHNEYKTIGL